MNTVHYYRYCLLLSTAIENYITVLEGKPSYRYQLLPATANYCQQLYRALIYTAHYCPLLATTVTLHRVRGVGQATTVTNYYYSKVCIVDHHTLLSITDNNCPASLTTVHHRQSLTTTAHRCLLLLTTAHYC